MHRLRGILACIAGAYAVSTFRLVSTPVGVIPARLGSLRVSVFAQQASRLESNEAVGRHGHVARGIGAV